MPERPPDLNEIGYYYSLAQAGLEMVAPLLVGLALDYYFGWLPWATVTGTVIGFVGGFIHLISMLNRREADKPSKPKGGNP